eukprot:3657175-Rhodomonas_salina.1
MARRTRCRIGVVFLLTAFLSTVSAFVHQASSFTTRSLSATTQAATSLKPARNRRPPATPMMLDPTTVSLLGFTALSSLHRAAKDTISSNHCASPHPSLRSPKARNGVRTCLNEDSQCACPPSSADCEVHEHKPSRSNGLLEAARAFRPYTEAVQKDAVNGTRLALRSSYNGFIKKRMMEEEYPMESMTIDDMAKDVAEKALDLVDKCSSVLTTWAKFAPHKVTVLSDLIDKIKTLGLTDAPLAVLFATSVLLAVIIDPNRGTRTQQP